jgi:hypothetical protein
MRASSFYWVWDRFAIETVNLYRPCEQWNTPREGVGYVTRFEVQEEVMDRYEIHEVGGPDHTEWWIPAEDLEALNDAIVGVVEVIGEYRPAGQH